MQIPCQSLEIAKNHFQSLPKDDINRKFYEKKETYSTKSGLFNKISNLYSMSDRIKTLKSFYPHQETIKLTEYYFNEYYR